MGKIEVDTYHTDKVQETQELQSRPNSTLNSELHHKINELSFIYQFHMCYRRTNRQAFKKFKEGLNCIANYYVEDEVQDSLTILLKSSRRKSTILTEFEDVPVMI